MLTFQDSRRPSHHDYQDSFYHSLASGCTDNAFLSYPEEHGTTPTFRYKPQTTIPHIELEGSLRRSKRESRALVFMSPETKEPIEHYRYSDQSSSSAKSIASEDGNSAKLQISSSSSSAASSSTSNTALVSALSMVPASVAPTAVLSISKEMEVRSELPTNSKLHQWMGILPSSMKEQNLLPPLFPSPTAPSPNPFVSLTAPFQFNNLTVPEKEQQQQSKVSVCTSNVAVDLGQEPMGLYFHGISNIWSASNGTGGVVPIMSGGGGGGGLNAEGSSSSSASSSSSCLYPGQNFDLLSPIEAANLSFVLNNEVVSRMDFVLGNSTINEDSPNQNHHHHSHQENNFYKTISLEHQQYCHLHPNHQEQALNEGESVPRNSRLWTYIGDNQS